MRLKNKVALLTGAAAAIKGELMGFGGATALVFARIMNRKQPNEVPADA